MPPFVSFIISWLVSFALIFLSEVSLLEHDMTDGRVLCRDLIISWVFAFLFALGLSAKGRSAFQLMPETTGRKNPADETYKQYPGGPSNHFNRGVADAGHLYLFPDSLVFHPGESSLYQSDIRIKYISISDVRPSTLNTIMVSIKEGETHRFAVEDKYQWVTDIKARMTDPGLSSQK